MRNHSSKVGETLEMIVCISITKKHSVGIFDVMVVAFNAIVQKVTDGRGALDMRCAMLHSLVMDGLSCGTR